MKLLFLYNDPYDREKWQYHKLDRIIAWGKMCRIDRSMMMQHATPNNPLKSLEQRPLKILY